MNIDNIGLYEDAIEDFRRARLRAKLEKIEAWLTGESSNLLDYEQVRKSLRAMGQISRGVQDIPIDAIVGSVGRYTDFSREFLPLKDNDASRWARVKLAMTDSVGLPPIEVYKIDQAYFVLDGNHRVSVARQLGATHIHAYVTEVLTDVPFDPDVQPDDLILKAEYADFVHATNLQRLRPQANLNVSVPGQYKKLLEHISVHRYYMGLELKRDISQDEAVMHWYDEVYMPVIRVIRELGVLSSFPGRTEADLYLWLMEYRVHLAEKTGVDVSLAPVAEDLVKRYSPTVRNVLQRVGARLLKSMTPAVLEDGPPPGMLRRRSRTRLQKTLFADILMAVDGSAQSWRVLSWVLELAKLEGSEVHGLHVTGSSGSNQYGSSEDVQKEFSTRLERAKIEGELTVQEGNTAERILDKARWMDMVAVSLTHPYDANPLSRLESGLRALIRRSPAPVLSIPDIDFRLERVLLAYDDSPKAREALFVATYLAGTCETCLDVVTIARSEHQADEILQYAGSYLDEYKVKAEFLHKEGSIGASILQTAEQRGADMIIMGGYGLGPVAELALGSAVDEVLRSRTFPVLVCQ